MANPFAALTRQVETVTRADIVAGLVTLGVRPGDRLVVHTALSSFGKVEGGAEAVLDAILDAIGPGGTAMFPAMTWRSCYLRDPAPPWPIWLTPYDPFTTELDRDMGRVPMAALEHIDARRSNHPLISVIAIGADAERIADDHPMEDPLRPYRNLAAMGGKVLLLGVDNTRNTTVHAAEFLMGLPHLSGPAYGLISDRNANSGWKLLRMEQEPDCSLGFGVLDKRVPRREAIIGGSIAWLMSGQQVIDAALGMLHQDRGALLCDHRGCRTCNRGRALYYPKPVAKAR